jgi:hypothetical protein
VPEWLDVLYLDVFYDDRLDGRIDASTFNKKAEEMRLNQQCLRTKINQCQSALLAPAAEAVDAIWHNAELRVYFREPFAQLQLSNSTTSTKDGQFLVDEANSDNWRRDRDSNPG